MKLFRTIISIILVIGIIWLVAGCVSFTTTKTTYIISGEISGAVQQGVTITLSGDSTTTTITDSTGKYSFSNLENGSYVVTPSLGGYTFSPASKSVTIDNAGDINIKFTSTAIQATTYNISGAVTLAGAGLQGVTITLSGASSATVTTDASGNYTFTRLANGNYTITPGKSGYSFSSSSSNQTINSSNLTTINFTATALKYNIIGNVTFNGTGFPGVTMTLSGSSSATVLTDASGNYTFTGFTNGNYTVTPGKTGYAFSPGSSSQTINGANNTGVNFTSTGGGYNITGTVNSVNGGSLQGVTVTLNTNPVKTAITDSAGNYTISNMPDGTYILTPSLGGANAVFNPVNTTVIVNNGNVNNQYFSSNVSCNISGTVNYNGLQTPGRVYINVYRGGDTGLGTSIAAPGSFIIHGVPAGTYNIQAWMDNSNPQTGAPTALSPFSSVSSVSVSNSNITGQNITLTDPSPVPAPAAPANVLVFPANGCALIQWQAAVDSNGSQRAQSYNIYYSTSSAVSKSTGTKKAVQANTDLSGHIIITGLNDGVTYYFIVSAVLGGIESSTSDVASATMGATSGSFNVSGTVTYPGTATGPLYALVYNDTTGIFFHRIANPSSPQAYSVSGVPAGTYMALSIVDMNNDGVIGIGDLSNTTSNYMNTFTISGNVTGANQILSGNGALFLASTMHWTSTSSSDHTYGLRLIAMSNVKLPVKVSVTAGPNIPLPIDMNTSQYNTVFVNLGSVKPAVGDTYVFAVTYSDGTSENLTAQVTTILNIFAQNLTVSGSNRNIPVFNWLSPASLPASYTYAISVNQNNGNRIWHYSGTGTNVPSSPTSVLFNVDGNATQASLTTGTQYNWIVFIQDAYGNQTEYQTTYTP
ncbi:MAG: carboxypeptidase regulatory-like domain-containing protein [Chloroflexi bacterium]|nr:carboxypeptidase regulatory-like domain-containing protein [Chloroflexota bacterium]